MKRFWSTIMTVALVGVAGVAGSAAPAYADEPGIFCTIASSGTVSAPPSVRYGQLVTVQWSVNAAYCAAPVAYIVGPGFGSSGEWLPLNGSRQVRAVTDGTSVTWSLYLFDLETDSQQTVLLSSRTTTVR